MEFQVFAKGVDKDMVVLMAARASRLENQDAIDAAIVSMLADPKEVMDLSVIYLENQHSFCFTSPVINYEIQEKAFRMSYQCEYQPSARISEVIPHDFLH